MTTPDHSELLSQIRSRMPLDRRYHCDFSRILSVRDRYYEEDEAELLEFVRLLEDYCGHAAVGEFTKNPEHEFESIHKTPIYIINPSPTARDLMVKHGHRLLGGYSISEQEFAVELQCPTIQFAFLQAKLCARTIVKPGTSSFVTVRDETALPKNQRVTRNNPRLFVGSSTYYWNSTVFSFKIYTCESKQGTKFNCPSQPWKHGRLVPVVRMEFRLKDSKNIRERLGITHPKLRFGDLFSRKAAYWWELLAKKSLFVGTLNVELLHRRIIKCIEKAGYVPSTAHIDHQFRLLMADEVFKGVPIDGFPQRLDQFLKEKAPVGQKKRGKPSKADIIHEFVVADLRKYRKAHGPRSFLVLNEDGGCVCNQILDSARVAYDNKGFPKTNSKS